MNKMQPGVHTNRSAKRSAKNWDLKLAAALFIGTCATMSLVLPNWRDPLAETHADPPGMYRTQSQAQAPALATTVIPTALNTPPPVDPQQQESATEHYQKGQSQMRDGKYNAAATEFKKALEQYPDFADAYVGLGDAFIHQGDYQAAETNARHALSELKLLKVGQAPDPHLKKELSYAHQVLGIALLHLAKNALDNHDVASGKMKALEAASHCNLAAVFDQSDDDAHSCAQQAAALNTHS
jgi:tetratricopeptide (TPR) repeat protein